MQNVTINMCGISFSSPVEWMFVPTESFILARPDSQIGLARIYMAEGIENGVEDLKNILPELLTADHLSNAYDEKLNDWEDYQFGAMSYEISRGEKTIFARVWYRIVNSQLYFALYGCPWSKREDEEALREQQQCEYMILTAKEQEN